MMIKGGYYITVEEFRQRMGYTTKRMIYKHLKRGDIPDAIHAGGRWLIPSNAVFIDKRVKHNQCRDWRRIYGKNKAVFLNEDQE